MCRPSDIKTQPSPNAISKILCQCSISLESFFVIFWYFHETIRNSAWNAGVVGLECVLPLSFGSFGHKGSVLPIWYSSSMGSTKIQSVLCLLCTMSMRSAINKSLISENNIKKKTNKHRTQCARIHFLAQKMTN